MRINRVLTSIGSGVAAGLLAGVIAAIISYAFQLPSSALYTIAIVTGIILGGLFSWFIRRHPFQTFRWSAVILFITGIAIVLSSYSPAWTNIIWDATTVGIGISLVSIAIAGFALALSRESNDRMRAMANLEFYEKIGVLEIHIANIRNNNPNTVTGNVTNDIKATMQLKQYVDNDIRQQFDTKIKELIEAALNDQPYAELIKQLQQILRDDC